MEANFHKVLLFFKPAHEIRNMSLDTILHASHFITISCRNKKFITQFQTLCVHASTPISLSLFLSLTHILKFCKSAWSLGMTVQATKRERERPYLLRSLSCKVTLTTSNRLFQLLPSNFKLRTSNRRRLDSLTKQVGKCAVQQDKEVEIFHSDGHTYRQTDRQTDGKIRLRAFSFSWFSVESSSKFSKVETKSDKQGRMML